MGSNETAEGNESKNKVVTNVIRKVTTTRKILRKVIIDGDGNEHEIEEIIDDPQVSISELEQPSIDIEEVQDKNDKLTSNSGLSKETLTNTSSKSEWTNIPIVRLDKMPSSPGVEIEELSDEEYYQTVHEEPMDLSTRLNVEATITTPSDDEGNVTTAGITENIEEIIDEPIDLSNKHKPLSNESSISSASSVITVIEAPLFKKSESTLSLDEEQPNVKFKPPTGKSKKRSSNRNSKLIKAEAEQHKAALRKRSESSG